MSIPLLMKRSQVAFIKQRQLVYHLLFLFIWVFTVYTGAIGVDFGSHWDERKLFKSIRNSIPEGKVLPGWYNYPSMIYDLTVLSAAPEILTTHFSNPSGFREIIERWFWGKEIKLRTRMLFFGITSLSLLWTYLLIFNWTRQRSQALFGSAILASSWELGYHARWIAPDAILMQFGILSVLLVFLAIGSSGWRKILWLVAAAVVAGMACGTKYFGGIFLVPVFIGAYKILRDTNAKWSNYVALVFILLAVFSLTFLLSTPGALMDTARMVRDIQYEIRHYGSGDTGYTVRPGWEHLSLLFVYLFGVFFSHYFWVSLLFSLFLLIGLYSLLTKSWRGIETWILFSVPFFYIPYMSLQKVMMVRNYLLLFPFLAVLSAKGIAVVWNSKLMQSKMIARTIMAIGVVSALLINYGWLYYAAESIPARFAIDHSQKLHNYLLANKGTIFYLSPWASSLVDRNGLANIVDDPSLADKLVFILDEPDHPLANRPGVYNSVFGPYEVNLDYYPSWNEDKRVIVMPMKAALSQPQFAFIYK